MRSKWSTPASSRKSSQSKRCARPSADLHRHLGVPVAVHDDHVGVRPDLHPGGGVCGVVHLRQLVGTAAEEVVRRTPTEASCRRHAQVADRSQGDDAVDRIGLVREPQHEVATRRVAQQRGGRRLDAYALEQAGQLGDYGPEVLGGGGPGSGPAPVLRHRHHEALPGERVRERSRVRAVVLLAPESPVHVDDQRSRRRPLPTKMYVDEAGVVVGVAQDRIGWLRWSSHHVVVAHVLTLARAPPAVARHQSRLVESPA